MTNPSAEADAAGASPSVLAVNGGSSSLKFALFDGRAASSRSVRGKIERIGGLESPYTIAFEDGHREQGTVVARSLADAARWLMDSLDGHKDVESIDAVGHRIVHGGPHYAGPRRIDPTMVAELHRIIPFDPDHLPGQLDLIAAMTDLDPSRPQVACFDTAFHRDLPDVARILPIPRRYEAMGLRKYGFHGLSYTYLLEELARIAGPDAAKGRIIFAHLGSGASLAAVLDGHCIDTTMGLTPAAGVVMATRSGDIDPGLPGILARLAGMTPDAFHAMTNEDSGLLGVSETSSDLRDLLARRDDDPRAELAVALFCRSVQKAIGGFAAILGGIDTLVFSGGIGEHSAEARRRILDGLGFLGLTLDDRANAENAAILSLGGAEVSVRVIPTDEELIIARQTRAVLGLR